jgi:hypothetical protein
MLQHCFQRIYSRVANLSFTAGGQTAGEAL